MKFIKLELEGGADGVLSEKQLDEVSAKMREVIDKQLPESEREEARRRADELVAELRGKTGPQLSAQSLIALLGEAERALEKLPRAIQAIAQTIDTPSHIYDLGGASSEVTTALAAVYQAKRALESMLSCKHCQPETEPSKENLS